MGIMHGVHGVRVWCVHWNSYINQSYITCTAPYRYLYACSRLVPVRIHTCSVFSCLGKKEFLIKDTYNEQVMDLLGRADEAQREPERSEAPKQQRLLLDARSRIGLTLG
jgi:hypothetical protein